MASALPSNQSVSAPSNAAVFTQQMSKLLENDKTPASGLHRAILTGDENRVFDWLNPKIGTGLFIHTQGEMEAEDAERRAEAGERRKAILTAASNLKVFPIHTAAMTGRTKIVALLIGHGANVNVKDARNWTPLHWAAAVCNDEMIAAFKSRNADETVLNHRNGTYKDILSLARLPDPKTQEFMFYDKSGTLQKGDGTDFQTLMHVSSFQDKDLYFPPHELFKDWLENLPSQSQMKVSKEKYFAFRDNPRPRVAVQQSQKLGGKQWALVAVDPIRSGEIFLEYLGTSEAPGKPLEPFYNIQTDSQGTQRLVKKYDPAKDYTASTIDGLVHRGLGPVANDSLPNTMLLAIDNVAGAPNRLVLGAQKEIKPGEEITHYYGPESYFRLGKPHIELKQHEMIEYFTSMKGNLTASFEKAVLNCMDPSSSPETLRESAYIQTRVEYLLTNFGSLILCIVGGAVQFPDLLNLFANFGKIIFENHPYQHRLFAELTAQLSIYFNKLSAVQEKRPAFVELIEMAARLTTEEWVLFLDGKIAGQADPRINAELLDKRILQRLLIVATKEAKAKGKKDDEEKPGHKPVSQKPAAPSAPKPAAKKG